MQSNPAWSTFEYGGHEDSDFQLRRDHDYLVLIQIIDFHLMIYGISLKI